MSTAIVTAPAVVVAQPVASCDLLINEEEAKQLDSDDFNPQKHICFKRPTKVHSMKDLGLPDHTGISSVAVSEPFPLFTAEAIRRMRAEVLSEEVMKNCRYSSDLAQCQLRGFAARYAPFVYDAWKDPTTLAIVSDIAGIDLVTVMDYEIGHVNIAVKSEEDKHEEFMALSEERRFDKDSEGVVRCFEKDDKPIVDWHCDSYPFVCVTMLSDCSRMVGGETALRTGTGTVLKVRGPQMGCAVVLQGRYIEHQALRALGATERITMVTSFRPRCAKVRDDSVLKTIRSVSNLSELYYDFSEYRLEILEERVRAQLKTLREAKKSGKKFPTIDLKRFLKEQVGFLDHMNEELVPEGGVKMGLVKAAGPPGRVVGESPKTHLVELTEADTGC